MEGLRCFPWLHDEIRRDPDAMTALKSCETCMSMNTVDTRQAMGCGYEPPLDAPPSVWQPRAFRGELSVCAGYTARLPEVIEVARARVHWTKGQLQQFLGAPASEQMMIAIEILEGASNELQNAALTPESEGGLAKG